MLVEAEALAGSAGCPPQIRQEQQTAVHTAFFAGVLVALGSTTAIKLGFHSTMGAAVAAEQTQTQQPAVSLRLADWVAEELAVPPIMALGHLESQAPGAAAVAAIPKQ